VQSEAVAKVLLFNEQDQILVMQTGIHKLRPERSHSPDLPGGMVDPGESEHAAVIREVQEESGIILDPNVVTLGYANTEMFDHGTKSVTKLLYIAKLSETPIVTLSWEHKAFEWSSVEALLENEKFRSTYRRGVEYLQNNQLI
jgi:8-oxo-dGTP pyrophosphatase MutT (NUDIX family)